MENSDGKVFLTGATGDVGSNALKMLRDASIPTRIICRQQPQVDDFRKQGADAVCGALDDEVDELAEHMKGAINTAIAAGLKWAIKISAADARDECNVPWVKAHAAADRYLREETKKRQIAWTILSPSAFMQNILSEAPAGKRGFLPQTSGHGKAGWIDTADIAAIASQVVIDGPEKQSKQIYLLTGPQLISMPDMANALSRQVGHNVRYLHLPGSLMPFHTLELPQH